MIFYYYLVFLFSKNKAYQEMINMKERRSKAITLFSLLTVLIAFFISPITTFAATVNYEKVANYISTWHVQSLGGLH